MRVLTPRFCSIPSGTAQLVPVAGNGSTGLHLVHDPEITAENPVSVKYHKVGALCRYMHPTSCVSSRPRAGCQLARGLMRGGRGGARLIDLELRPNREEKRRIDDVVNDPSNRVRRVVFYSLLHLLFVTHRLVVRAD